MGASSCAGEFQFLKKVPEKRRGHVVSTYRDDVIITGEMEVGK